MASDDLSAWDDLSRSVEVWLARPSELSPPLLRQVCLPWLGEPERIHYDALANQALQHDYLAGRALCRAALSGHAPVQPPQWRFLKGELGKPAVLSPSDFTSLRFNLSGAGDLAACAVTRAGDVGVDVEDLTRQVDIEELTRQFFPEPERLALEQLPPPQARQRFFEIWVLKEAYLKGLGTGLWQSPEDFQIEFGPDGPLPIGDWQLLLHHVDPRHVAALAIHAPHATLSIRWRFVRGLSEAGIAVE